MSTTLMFGCEVTAPQSERSHQQTKEMALLDEIQTGMVRQLVFESLYNYGMETCLDGLDNVTMAVISRSDAYYALQSWASFAEPTDLEAPLSLYVEELLNGGYNNAVLIETPSDGDFIYILNDGTFGIDLPTDPTDLRNAGILISLNPLDPENDQKTRLVCDTWEGSYGTGCTCTRRTITVVCEPNEFCACPGGGQCEGSCNRTTDWSDCDNAEIYTDDVPFMDWNPGDWLHGEHL